MFWQLWKSGFRLRGKRYIIELLNVEIRDDPATWTWGMESRVPGTNLHVLFIDYDTIREDVLENEVRFLQQEFELGNFYLFQTEDKGVREDGEPWGNYHAICLDMFTLRDRYQILLTTSTEWAFKNAPKIYPEKAWVLRYAEKGERKKPDFLKVIESPFEGKNDFFQSSPHAKFIDAWYETDIDRTLVNPKGSGTIRLNYYNTGSKVKKAKTEVR